MYVIHRPVPYMDPTSLQTMKLTSNFRPSRWDSSDPVRAPPPLPLNPGSPKLTTRSGTSAAIAQAAKALEEKARESMPISSYTTNPLPQRSPERSLIKGAHHKRMQSFQTTGVKDLRSYLETHRSPERSPERPPTRAETPPREPSKDYFGGDLSPSRITTPTPPAYDAFKETPPLRPSSRPSHKAILGENTPPSATMMALQTMTVPPHIMDPPLANITNTAPKSPPATMHNLDISNQLLSITSIVSNLQKDMTQLSRRSKDNATDLISLKEATNSRDEDIRKSLKDLVATMNHTNHSTNSPVDFSQSQGSSSFKDPHMTPTKQFTLPRIASPSSFFLDDRTGSPNPYSVEGAASVAMLEKIIREMVTKDGQERLISNLQKIVDNANGETAKKVTELVEFVKQSSGNNSLIRTASGPAAFQASPGTGSLTRTTSEGISLHKVADSGKPYASPKAADFVSEEMLKFLRKIKDSVAESGSVTMSTKTLVQDLRGEVLGMGRKLAQQIEEVEHASAGQSAIESGQPKEQVSMIVQEGLADLKDHMDKVMRDRRRQSISSTVTRTTVDNNEVYDVVKHALAERGLDGQSPQAAGLDREAILSAVREAYEAYKPHIEVEQFGLERDEILDCLREGLQEYRGSGNVSKEEIEHMIQDSLQQMKLPAPINESHEIREEVVMAVRECLDELRPSLSQNSVSSEVLTREAVYEVVKEALAGHDAGPHELEISQDSLYGAIKAALESSDAPSLGTDNAALQRLQSLVDNMHSEFEAHSSANGRDTEQVLDALQDGLDQLRAHLEGYINDSAQNNQKDEVMNHIRSELENLRGDFQGFTSESSRGDESASETQTISFIKSEFEHLLEQVTVRCSSSEAHKNEILQALDAGFEGMKSQVAVRGLDLDSNDDINEAMKQEFEQLKNAILGESSAHKGEVLEKIQAGFAGIQARLDESGASTDSNNAVMITIKDEFEHLRETLGSGIIRPGGASDKEDIIDAMREIIESVHSSQADASKTNIAAIQESLDNLKESMGNALVKAEDPAEKDQLLEILKNGLEEIKQNSKAMGFSEELLEAFRGELEQVRESNGITRQHARADAEEVLEAVRLGLDDLRSHLEKKLDNPDRHHSAADELLDALNDGLDGLRADILKAVDKPVDMTVSYEILDTLKSGLASLREDVDKLKDTTRGADIEEPPVFTGNEIVLAEAPEQASAQETSREIVGDFTPHNDLEKVEGMLSQLQVKIEAIDANIHLPQPAESTSAESIATKDDLINFEAMLKDVQAAVLSLQEREQPVAVMEGVATKEDTDAIEILLGNVKAKIDELPLVDPETAITKENLDEIELVVRTTSEAIEALSKKIEEEGASKADVTVVQVIADDIKVALDEMKAANLEDEADPKATKADVDGVTLLVDEVKAKLDDLPLPNPEDLPTKADVEQLTGLVQDFRESYDKMKDQYEHDIKITAETSDHRRQEAAGLLENLTDVKVLLDDMKEEMKTNLAEGGPIDNLKVSFKSLEDNITENFNVTADVKELMETVSREFERAHGSIEALQNDQAEKSALGLEKQDEAKEAIISGLVEKIDGRFDILMAKYDDAQLLADEQAKVMKEKAEEQEKILESTKAMADELRLTIDTLGASITGINDRFEEATTKWTTDSSAMTEKLDEAMTKFEDQKMDDKTEHSHTRDELKNIENIFNGLQDNVTEYHPKFMVALHEIEALVKAHYEHAQQAKAEAEEHTRSLNEEARTRAEELQKHFSNLPALLPPPPPAIEMPERYDDAHVQQKLDKLLELPEPPKYDDAPVQEKLDKLLIQVDEASKSTASSERLEQIHAQVKATAAEVSEFVAKQTQLITDGNESKEREAEELALLVERRSAQKEQLETDIQDLKADKELLVKELREEKARAMAELKEEKERTIQEMKEEKDSLLAIVAALQAERENLANQKVRLTGEVSSLHTALDIRREELHMMDAKADALERRILNGIMDHSRALMIAKGGQKSPSKLKKRASADSTAEASKLMPPPSTAASGLSFALKPRPAIRRNGPPQNPTSRRIHSLSQISGNTPTGAQSYPTAGAITTNAGGIKRSHSVKTNPLRKVSWGGRPSAIVANKENETLNEEDEEGAGLDQSKDLTIVEHHPDDAQSQTGTERRYSVGTESYAGSYADGETPGFERRSSYGATGSEYSGSSYMSGSDVDRRTSFGSNAHSNAHHGSESVDDRSEDGSDYEHSDAEDDEPTATIATSELTAPSAITGSEVTGSELSTMTFNTEDVGLPTKSEVDRAVQAVMGEMSKEGIYAPPSDSGVGTDLPTAAFGNESEADADYFRRAAEADSVVG